MKVSTPVFQYDSRLLARFPTIVGGVILAEGLVNGASPPELTAAFRAEQARVRERIGATPLSQLPSLGAWRSVFRAFGVEPTQVRSAAEALLRRLTKQGDIPSINTLVDLGNMVSIRYALPVALFDIGRLELPITVRFASGSEPYTPLGQQQVEHPEPGEVVFTDERQLVIARRWCWRQSDESAARPATTAAIVTVEAHHAGARDDIAASLGDIQTLLNAYAGATIVRSAVLDVSNPRLD